MDFDVFNGDADGICGLQQLRLAEPRASTLVTGLKRDIALLGRVEAAAGDRVTVLDISLEKNREALDRLLAAGVRVQYIDHHFAGTIPRHPALESVIDTASEVCTSLLVDRVLGGRFRRWAVVGAFGDNLDTQARELAGGLGLAAAETEALRMLGICLNYNGYGASLDDLFFSPEALFRLVSHHHDPLTFIAEEPAYETLREGYRSDMREADRLTAAVSEEGFAVYLLPDAKWSRRVAGVFGNALAQAYPKRAHALLTVMPDASYRVSVRAPLANRTGADDVCRRFPTGGGRKAAAGINDLPASSYAEFCRVFEQQYTR